MDKRTTVTHLPEFRITMYKFCFLQSKMILVISIFREIATEALNHRKEIQIFLHFDESCPMVCGTRE